MLRTFFLLLFSTNLVVYAQQSHEYFKKQEDSLRGIAFTVLSSPLESEKLAANELLKSTLLNVLKQEGSPLYPFDSLKYVSVLTSDDQKVRIFTWSYTTDQRQHFYSGIVQVMSNNKLLGFLPVKKKPRIERVTLLADESETIENPEKQILDAKNWYGALYYDIISPPKGKRNYILLGWDGHNDLLTRKIIEVMTLNGRGDPRFGDNLFKYESKPVKRVILEYSDAASVSLRYNASEKMIVFDHLEPSNPMLKGNREYYGPDFSYEGYQFDRGRWEHIMHVIPKNENTRKKYTAPK